MSTSKPVMLVAVGVLAVLGLGGGLLVLPAYRESAELNRRIDELHRKSVDVEAVTSRVQRLRDELTRLEERVRTQLKSIPDAPDVAGLIRKLSLPVDGATVKDQQFVAGQPNSAVPGEESGLQAMPVTVELTATFEAVYTLLRSVESMDRLVRVTSVRVGCKRAPDSLEDVSHLAASLGLEAIYESATPTEVK